jgi:hypothetical protein
VEWARVLADSALYALPIEGWERKNRREWIVNRLKGSAAEICCSLHFEALGYAMQPLGVEHVAANHVRNRNEHRTPPKDARRGNEDKEPQTFFKSELSILPDFLASRFVPRRFGDDADTGDGQSDSFMVEVKYRTEVRNLEALAKGLYADDKYGKIIKRGGDIAFYLVTGEAKEDKKPKPGRLFVNRSWDPERKWATPAELGGDARFAGARVGETFETIYTEAVREALSAVLALKEAEDDATSTAARTP